MLNVIWVGMILVALACGAWNGSLDAVAKASTESATNAVTFAIGLVGVMAFWLGLMRVLSEGGFLNTIARLVRPVMCRLFPDVPATHPAMSMMILNMSSNVLGLANAATPFGLKAMAELDKLNSQKGTATNAMALFLAINTAGHTLFPTGIVALRASLGSTAPGSIVVTTWIATVISTIVAIVTAKLIIRSGFSPAPAPLPAEALAAETVSESSLAGAAGVATVSTPPSRARRLGAVALGACFVGVVAYAFAQRAVAAEGGQTLGASGALKVLLNNWLVVLLIGVIVLYGVARGVKVYDAVVEGGKEGFNVALRIIPFLVAMLVAVGMLRASGAITILSQVLEPVTSLIGMPAETLPMALLRPLTGSGAYAVAGEIMKTHGADSLIGTIVSTMQGSSETTFYVLAVYFGSVQVRNTRFTLLPCLLADGAGVIASVWMCRLLLF